MRKNKELKRNVEHVVRAFTNGNPISSGVLITRVKRKLFKEGYAPRTIRAQALYAIDTARQEGLVRRIDGGLHRHDIMYERVK